METILFVIIFLSAKILRIFSSDLEGQSIRVQLLHRSLNWNECMADCVQWDFFSSTKQHIHFCAFNESHTPFNIHNYFVFNEIPDFFLRFPYINKSLCALIVGDRKLPLYGTVLMMKNPSVENNDVWKSAKCELRPAELKRLRLGLRPKELVQSRYLHCRRTICDRYLHISHPLQLTKSSNNSLNRLKPMNAKF